MIINDWNKEFKDCDKGSHEFVTYLSFECDKATGIENIETNIGVCNDDLPDMDWEELGESGMKSVLKEVITKKPNAIWDIYVETREKDEILEACDIKMHTKENTLFHTLDKKQFLELFNDGKIDIDLVLLDFD